MNAMPCSRGAVRSFACMRVDRSHDVPQRRGYSIYNMASILWKGCYSSWRKIRGPAGRNVQKRATTSLCLAISTGVFCPVLAALAQNIPPTPLTGQAGVTIEQVIVTGSNIPTAEEIGPNPVDTYRPADIEKLGIRNATDLQTFLPQEAGSTVNLNRSNGDGTVQINLRGPFPKEALVLVDGKRVAYGSLAGAGSSQGVDINLIPFPMIDHIDILKDGASAVYGSDAIAGVINFFLIHKFRGLEI